MTIPVPPPRDPKSQLRRSMGFWDVLLFNIAAVLGPRWIAAAGHNGASSISLWVLAALFFFVPGALVINELSSRFPEEGGLYAWARDAFGPFHGFVAGWTYWIYTVFYFPGLLLASASMSAYISSGHGAALAENRTFLLWISLGAASCRGAAQHHRPQHRQMAAERGRRRHLPAPADPRRRGRRWFACVTARSRISRSPACAPRGTGTPLTSGRKSPSPSPASSSFPAWPKRCAIRAALCPARSSASGALIALMYIAGTFAVLALAPAGDLDPKSGVFQAIAVGSSALRIGFIGVIAAVLVTAGNAGGVGSTVAGVARVPFQVGIDRYLPAAFGKIHPRWKTPYIAILVQAVLSGVILLLSQISETTRGAYQVLIDAAIILYFIPFLYMFAAVIKLAGRKDRAENPHAVLVPGGKLGVWLCGGLGFLIVLLGIFVSLVPPGDTANKLGFELKLVVGTVVSILIGLALYWRGARDHRNENRGT